MPKLRRSSRELPNYPIEPGADARAMDQVRRELRHERRAAMTKRVGTAIMAASIYTAAFVGNDIARGINEGEDLVRDDHAQVHEIYDNPEADSLYAHHATFVLTGLGTKDPSATAETLTAHREVGGVFALEYSNKNLDTTDMAKQVIAKAKSEGLTQISFDGYSAGGPVALDIAAYIHQREPNLRVVSVRLNSSPIGKNSLTERSEDGIRVMNRILSLYPDFAYYERGRIGVEVLARSDRYLQPVGEVHEQNFLVHDTAHYSYRGILYKFDLDKLTHEIRDVEQKMQNPSVASAVLIKHQADFITETDYDENLKILSRQRTGTLSDPVPFILYTRSHRATSDSVVDIDASERNITASLEKYGNPHEILRGSVGHANPTERTREYQKMISSDVNPRVADVLALYRPSLALPKELLHDTSAQGK